MMEYRPFRSGSIVELSKLIFELFEEVRHRPCWRVSTPTGLRFRSPAVRIINDLLPRQVVLWSVWSVVPVHDSKVCIKEEYRVVTLAVCQANDMRRHVSEEEDVAL